MPLKWVAFAVVIWVFGMVLGSILEGTTPLGSDEANILTQAALPAHIADWGGWLAFMGGLFRVMTLEFSFFQGDFIIIRYLLLAPVIIVLMYGVVITVMSLAGTLFQRL